MDWISVIAGTVAAYAVGHTLRGWWDYLNRAESPGIKVLMETPPHNSVWQTRDTEFARGFLEALAPIEPLTADEEPPEGCTCDYDHSRVFCEEFHRITRTWQDPECPLHKYEDREVAFQNWVNSASSY